MKKKNVWVSRNNLKGEPVRWYLDADMLRITVLCDHAYHPGEWVMHCYQVGLGTLRMKITTEKPAEYAQNLALKMVRMKLKMMIDSLPEEQ